MQVQSTMEITTHPQDHATHDQLIEESSTGSSAAESSISSPIPPTFSPILSMSPRTTTDSSTQDNGVHLYATKPTSKVHTYKLVGDNIDKNVKPRDMRIDSQTQSLHYFHAYAVRDRINVSHMDDQLSLPSLDNIDLAAVLPTEKDHKAIKGLFSIHVARVLKKFFPFFAKFGQGLEQHIKHDFFKEMSQKSEVVGV